MLLFYTFNTAFLELNIWRPFTALFFMGKFDFNFIFNIYFAYIALSKV
jgi:Der1-like family